MLSNRLAFAALGVACIGAAAGGGYLATRQNTIPTPASAEAQMTAPAAGRPAEAARPVQETEGVVGDAASRPAATTTPTAPKATLSATTPRRAEAQATVARDERSKTPGREQPPALTSTWPSSAASQPPAAPPVPPATTDAAAPAPRADDRADHVPQEPPRAPEPPQKTFEELVIPADSVIGLQTENRLSSETARVEDRVEARVTRDVKVGDRVAIPAGARALGSVMQVERGGKFKERARLGIRFNMLVLADGTRVPINTETIVRDGEAPGNSSAAKVGGGAVVGTILGAIIGGSKGAAIGGAAGAASGGAAVMATDRSAATFLAGTPVTVRILSPITITNEKDE